VNTLRASAAAVVLASLLAVAWTLSAGSCGGTIYEWECATPSGQNLGNYTTANAGAYGDCPCVCCTSGPGNGQPYPQGNCPWYDGGTDSGGDADGGPIPSCDGACWPGPLPGPEWMQVLLWTAGDASAPQCPAVAPTDVFDGNAELNNTAARACGSTASGWCAGLGEVCGPASASGFVPCIMQEDNHPCVGSGPYPVWSLLYQGAPPEPVSATTFCCAPAPIMPP
jgi:hypothetical protein